MDDLTLAKKLFGKVSDIAPSASIQSGAPKNNTTAIYATATENSAKGFVKLSISGEEIAVPTTFAVKRGDVCLVTVSERNPTVTGVVGKGDAVDTLIAGTIQATTAIISQIIAGSVSADTVEATKGYFETLEAEDFSANKISATTATIVTLISKDAQFDSLSATKAVIGTLEAAKAFIEELEANEITVENLVASMATIGTLDAKYANIDFANVDVANIGEFFAKSGIIENVITESGTVTGELVGVTIKGDLIEAGTIKADKVVIKGEDGLYYKLNTSGTTVEAEQTDYNSVNGSSIQAKSITATKISVSDLVAFGAKIGGLVIENSSIHSAAKTSATSGVDGFFFGDDGTFAVGDSTSFVRFAGSGLEISLGGSPAASKSQVDAAAKSATDFLQFSTSGLEVGNKKSGAWSGFRTRMTSAAFEVLSQAGATLASYGANIVELGKDSVNTIIKLCAGKGSIAYYSQTDQLAIMAQNSLAVTTYTTVGGVQQPNDSGIAVNKSGCVLKGKAMFSGAVEVDEGSSVLLKNATDIDGGVYNSPALTIGSPDGIHLEFDNNEIMCKYSRTAVGKLNLNGSGGEVTVHGYPIYGARTLYSNASGSNGTIALSNSAANFAMLEIYYKSNDGENCSVKVADPNGKVVNLAVTHPEGGSNGAVYWKSRSVVVSGGSIASDGTRYTQLGMWNGNNVVGSLVNYVYITKVIGYR